MSASGDYNETHSVSLYGFGFNFEIIMFSFKKITFVDFLIRINFSSDSIDLLHTLYRFCSQLALLR